MRISHRNHNQKNHQAPAVNYVERIVEVPVEVPVDQIVMQEWCKQRIDEQNTSHALLLQDHKDYNTSVFDSMQVELEMQRRALVAIKAQRDVDRSRRLLLIKRMKKEHDKHKNTDLKLKLAVGASLIISFIALFWH